MKKKSLSVLIALSLAVTTALPAASVFAVSTSPVTAGATATAPTAPASAYGVQYQGHVQSYGWGYMNTGNTWVSNQSNTVSDANVTDNYAAPNEEIGTTGLSKRLEAVQLSLAGTGLPAGAHLQYQVQGQSYGWQAPVEDGQTAGTTGLSKRIEAIAISLTGLPGYEVQYKAHVQKQGWDANWTTGPSSLGSAGVAPTSFAGTVGKSLRLEALDIRIVKTDAENAAEVAAITAVNTAVASQAQADIAAATTAVQAVQDATENAALTAQLAAITPVATQLAVSSVSAINLKQIKVVFNKAVDPTSATTLTNYAFAYNNTTQPLDSNDTVVLQPDGKTVIITVGGSTIIDDTTANQSNVATNEGLLINQTAYALQVSNVRDTASNVIATTTNNFTALDAAIPTATGVTVVAPGILKVQFSAPITAASLETSDFSIDNGQYSISNATFNYGDNTALLNLGTALIAGAHTVTVSPTDGNSPAGYNGFNVVNTTLNFNIVADTSTPAFTVSNISLIDSSHSMVQVKFNKPVALSGNADIYYSYDKNSGNQIATTADGTVDQGSVPATYTSTAAESQLSSTEPVVIDASGTTFNFNGTTYADTYDLYVSAALPAGNTTIYIDNDKDVTTGSTANITDVSGNVYKSSNATGSLVVDTSIPQVNSVVMNGQNEIDVTYSKTMNTTSATTGSNYVLKNSAGQVVTSSLVSGILTDTNGSPLTVTDYTATKGYYALNLGAAGILPAGQYTLTISGVTDDVVPTANTIATKVYNLTVTDTQAPTQPKVTTNTAGAAQDGTKIFVYYNKPMNTSGADSILDVNNYQLAPVGSSTLAALPSGTTITPANNNTEAIITLPSGTNSAAGTGNFAVGSVKDTNGNIYLGSGAMNITNDGFTAQYGSASDIVPESLKVTGEDTLTFEVDKPLQSVNHSSIELYDASADDSALGIADVSTSAYFVNQQVDSGKEYGALVTVKFDKKSDGVTTDTSMFKDDISNLTHYNLAFTNDNALVNINGSNLTDNIAAASEVIAVPTNTTADSTYAETGLNFNDYIAPSFSAVTSANALGELNEINVTFSEPVQASSISASTFGVSGYAITDVQPTGTAYAAGGAGGATNTTDNNGDATLGYKTYTIFVTPKGIQDGAATPTITLLQGVKDNSLQHNVEGAGTTVTPVDAIDLVSTVTAAPNSATTFTVSYNEALYTNSGSPVTYTAVTNGEDIAGQYSITGHGASITHAIYNATAKTVTFTVAGATAGTSTISAATTLSDNVSATHNDAIAHALSAVNTWN